jgi:septal ring factor EnvC (AmiA/AmiB activator)
MLSRLDRRENRGSRRLTLLVVDGARARALRLSVRRRVACATGAVLALGLLALAWLVADYLSMKRQWQDVAALRREIEAERSATAEARARLEEIEREVEGWHDLHARIWQPLVPDRMMSGGRGVGGGTAAVVEGGVLALTPLVTQIDRLASSIRVEGQSLKALEQLMTRARWMLAALPSRWPLRGAVNSEFGRRASPWSRSIEFHNGIDIAAEPGSPVAAPAAGLVVVAGLTPTYGKTVVIDHGREVKTLFAHLERIDVAEGQRIERGQQIALSGNTGKSSGPHLHYEITVRGQPVDPRGFLWD